MLSKSLAETEKIVADFLVRLKPLADRALHQADGQAVVVGLSGDLGSGKTTFSQSLAKQLGVVETVTSPTFVIQKIYLLENKDFKKLIHIDCYRLNGGAEMAKIGWAEIVADPENLIVVEWPEKIADILPADMIKVDFAFVDEATREITFHD